jgi:hypothetical protein
MRTQATGLSVARKYLMLMDIMNVAVGYCTTPISSNYL